MAKKILLSENADQAAACIENIEKIYISRISVLASAIRELGIIDIEKQLIVDCINKNWEPLKKLYEKLYSKEAEQIASHTLREQIRASFEAKRVKVVNAVDRFYEKEVKEHLPFGLQVLAGVWEIEKGRIFIPGERKEVIAEGFKKWIEKPELLQVYNLHIETGNKMQQLWDAMIKAGMIGMVIIPASQFMSLYEIKANEEGVKFIPRKLNYDI